ncbi:hypothetical protein ColKHC_06093 [Colletotrichum higginsianum]|nr:hypothetical protein ColKHC_06093 [Colletotrichum higginsianum]
MANQRSLAVPGLNARSRSAKSVTGNEPRQRIDERVVQTGEGLRVRPLQIRVRNLKLTWAQSQIRRKKHLPHHLVLPSSPARSRCRQYRSKHLHRLRRPQTPRQQIRR